MHVQLLLSSSTFNNCLLCYLHMESMNTTSYLRGDGFNECTEVPPNNTGEEGFVTNVAVLVVCVLGLPGNLLVIAVYLRLQTTSTRVYMFTLAVADLASCVSGVVMVSTPLPLVALYLFLYTGNTANGFSAMLLAFISTERLFAVRRPVAFSNASERAKKAVVRLAVFDVVFIAAFEIARHTCCPLFSRILVMIVLSVCVVVMIICYFLMTITLLKNARTARTNVGLELAVMSSAVGTCAGKETHVDTTVCPTQVTPAQQNSSSKAKSEKNATHYKNVYLLFTVTAVYIVSWLPLWLAYGGVSVSRDVQYMFILNSVVNPFIYSIMSAMFRNDLRMFCRKTHSRLVNCL